MKKLFLIVYSLFAICGLSAQNKTDVLSYNLNISLDTVFSVLNVDADIVSANIDPEIKIFMKKKYDDIFFLSSRGLEDIKTETRIILPENNTTKYFNIKMAVFNSMDTVYFYVGLNQSDDRLLIIDINQNKSFKDDKLYVFPDSLDKTKKIDFYMSERIDVITQSKNNILDTVAIKILPFVQFYEKNTEFEKRTDYSILINYKYVGTVNIQNQYYELEAYSNNLGKYKNGKELIFFCHNIDIPLKERKRNLNNNSEEGIIYFDSLKYKITKISENRDTITLNFKGIEKDSTLIGNKISNAKYFSLSTGEVKQLYNIQSKLLLIDFWGTWCGPCVASIPALKTLRDKYKNKGLEVLSIAGIGRDDKTEIKKTEEFCKQRGMDWLHGYDLMNNINDNSILEKLLINTYPTYILVDESKKIIAKGELNVISNVIDKLLKKD